MHVLGACLVACPSFWGAVCKLLEQVSSFTSCFQMTALLGKRAAENESQAQRSGRRGHLPLWDTCVSRVLRNDVSVTVSSSGTAAGSCPERRGRRGALPPAAVRRAFAKSPEGQGEGGMEKDPQVGAVSTSRSTLEPWFYDGQVSQGTELQGESNSIFRKNNWKLCQEFPFTLRFSAESRSSREQLSVPSGLKASELFPTH